MAFLICCENKKCREYQEPLLDEKNNKVVCSICNEEIKNITQFAKNQLKFSGQIKRGGSKKQSFSVKCKECSVEGTPVLKKNKLFCAGCEKELKVTAQFKLLFLEKSKE